MNALPFLRVVTLLVEAAVISVCAATAVSIATEHGGSIWDASIVGAIAAVECLRVPTAMAIPKLRWSGALCAIALCLMITPLTAEGMILAADRLVHARSLGVAQAQDELERAEAAYAALKAEADRRDQAIAEARRHRADIDKPLSLAPVPSGTCSSRGRNGLRATYDCRATLEATAANRAVLEAHSAELKQADAAVKAAESTPPVPLEQAAADEARAKARLAVERNESVMHRAAAAWFGVTPAELSDSQFQAFARVAIGAQAISISTATMLAAFVSNLPRWDGKPSRLARALRAMLAATRKRLRRVEPTIVTQFRDRTVFVHVPVSPDGVVLDRPPRVVDPHGPRVAAE
jgi:hypothetical protein